MCSGYQNLARPGVRVPGRVKAMPQRKFGRMLRTSFASLVAFCLFLAPAKLAFAQQKDEPSTDLANMSLEELMNVEVSTASKHPQNAQEAPSSVTVITAEEIARYGYRTLSDVLQSVRGFYVTNDRNYSYIGVRGFSPPGDYNSRILILLDGHRLNENIYSEALIGTELPVDLDAVERIEIVRGPGSSLYGSDAVLAVINIITKSRKDFQNGRVSTEAGSFGSYKGRFTFAETLPHDVDMVVAGSIYESSGHPQLFFPEFDSPATNYGIAQNADADSAKDFLVKLTYREFTLEGNLGTRDKVIPTASFGTVFNNPGSQTVDSEGNFVLSYEKKLDPTTSFLTRVSYNRYEYGGDYIYPNPEGPLPTENNRDTGRGDWWTWEGQVRKQIGEHNDVTAGGEFTDNTQQNQDTYIVNPYQSFLDLHQESKVYAGFAQDELKINSQLILNGGIRYDHYDTFGGTFNPRLALLYRVNHRTNLKFLYGQAFRAPNDYELYYSYPGEQEANPALRPEKIRTYEAVAERYLGSHLQLSASGYYYHINDLIRQVADPTNGLLIYENSQMVDAKGIEIEANGKWFKGLETKASYCLQNATDSVTGAWLANSPKHLAKVNVMAPFFNNALLVGAEGQYTSDVLNIYGDRLGGFGLLNVTLMTRKLIKGTEFSVSGYNLLDKRYSDPVGPALIQVGIPQDGRALRVKAAYSF
ncbi:MAG: TonB-dependent receptor [Terriglobales bacterium]|jgi:iron complex outermembrane receptor protein